MLCIFSCPFLLQETQLYTTQALCVELYKSQCCLNLTSQCLGSEKNRLLQENTKLFEENEDSEKKRWPPQKDNFWKELSRAKKWAQATPVMLERSHPSRCCTTMTMWGLRLLQLTTTWQVWQQHFLPFESELLYLPTWIDETQQRGGSSQTYQSPP